MRFAISTSGDRPISLAILLDISGSMAVGGNMDRAREAVAVATINLQQREGRSRAVHVRLGVARSRRLHDGHARDSQGQPEGQASNTIVEV